MTPNKLPQEVANVLNQRLSDEYAAHYFYRQCANYCENVGYLKAAAYFKEVEPYLITFAAPAIGNGDFVKYMNTHVSELIYVHGPTIPCLNNTLMMSILTQSSFYANL